MLQIVETSEKKILTQTAKRKMKRGKKEKMKAAPLGPDRGTPERAQKNGGLIIVKDADLDGDKRPITHHKARCECQLDVYWQQNKITKRAFDAGMRFRAAFLMHAQGIKTRDSSIPSMGCGGDAEKSINDLLYAERVINEAYNALHDRPAQSLLVVSVCGCDEPVSKHIKTLDRALERLADCWGLQ